MAKCPNCGELGAIVINRGEGSTTFYCNLCGEEIHLPTWWGIAFERCKNQGINKPFFGAASNFEKEENIQMSYTPLTYPCPKCGSSRVAQDAVCAQKDMPLMLEFFCCDCGHKWEHPYEPPNVKMRNKEATMQVTYNGFTGELVKLEREESAIIICIPGKPNGIEYKYAISIYDSEKNVTHSFTGVKLEDMKFMSGEVNFK